MRLSLENVEQFFYDKKFQQVLPDLAPVFQKWIFGTRSGIRKVAKDALLDFLNGLTPDHLDKIGSYLGSTVSVQKIDTHLVRCIESDVYTLENKLNVNNLGGNFIVTRKGDQVYLCTWR
jgi:hypothetical protein